VNGDERREVLGMTTGASEAASVLFHHPRRLVGNLAKVEREASSASASASRLLKNPLA
jgi:hypothetical protein